MSPWIVLLIVVIVLGLIVGNLLLLKDTAKFKMPKVENKDAKRDPFDDEEDDW